MTVLIGKVWNSSGCLISQEAKIKLVTEATAPVFEVGDKIEVIEVYESKVG